MLGLDVYLVVVRHAYARGRADADREWDTVAIGVRIPVKLRSRAARHDGRPPPVSDEDWLTLLQEALR